MDVMPLGVLPMDVEPGALFQDVHGALSLAASPFSRTGTGPRFLVLADNTRAGH